MKKVLFFLLMLLSLSSCQKLNDDFKLIHSGELEKVENNNVFVDGESYQFDGDVKDYLLNENLKVGDEVNVYSDGYEFVFSKVDLEQAIPLVKKVSFFYNLDVFAFFIYVMLVLFVGYLLIAFLFEYFDIDVNVGKFLARFVSFVFVIQTVLLCFPPMVKYEKAVQLDDMSKSIVTLQGEKYPRDKVFYLKSKAVAGKKYLLYSFGDEYLLADFNSLNAKQPELFAQAVNQRINYEVKNSFFIWLIVLLLLCIPDIYSSCDNSFRIRVIRKHKERSLQEEVTASGGHGSFV